MIPLDPNQWESPQETFIAVIRRCEYSDTDHSKTKEGETFTEFFKLPRPAQTWEVAVERLDAVYINKVTREESPMVRYQTLQLERFDDRKKQMVPVTQGDNKNSFVIGKWLAAKVKLQDPTSNVGLVCQFTLEKTHKFGGNHAKNLLYPTKVLGSIGVEGKDDFEYNGDVEGYEFDPDRDGATSLDDAAAAIDSANKSNSASSKAKEKVPALSDADLLKLFVGKSPDDEDAATEIVQEHKASLTTAQKTSLITGSLIEAALEEGKLVVVDEVYALA